MNIIAKDLWVKIQRLLEAFAEKITQIDPSLISKVGNTTNDAFFVSGYLSFIRHADGDEIAISIDAQTNGEQLTIDSDVCADNGQIIAQGPTAKISLSDNQPNLKAALDDWLDEFGRFLQNVEPTVIKNISKI